MIYRMQDARKIKIEFNPFAKGFTPEQVNDAYYRLTCDPKQALLILECADMASMDAEYGGDEQTCNGCIGDCDRCGSQRDNGMVLEAVRVKAFSRTAQTMAALAKALNRYMADKGLTVGVADIGKPRQSGLFATVTVQFPVSDGQTITIVFHSPDNNKMKITAADEILAFRWLLNKRDITVAVSPEGEADVSLEEVGRRVAMLVEKNAKLFAAKSKDIAEQKKQLEDVQGQVAAAQGENQTLLATLTETQAQSEQIDTAIQTASEQLVKVQEFNADLQRQVDELQATQTGNKGKGEGERKADWETKPPYDDEYSGPRFKYGLMNRPMSIGTQPKGSILMSYKPDDKPETSKGKARHGTLEYPFRLTEQEIYNFELLDLTGLAEIADAEALRVVLEEYRDELVGRGFIAAGTDDVSANAYALSVGDEILKTRFNDYGKDGYGFVAGTEGKSRAFGPVKSLNLLSNRALPAVFEYIDKMIGELKKKEQAAPAIDPTSPSGYAQIMADPELQLKYQDVLDAFFQSRIYAVRTALKALGWEPNMKDPKLAFQSQKTIGQTTFWVSNDYVQVGAGANVVGVTAKIQSTTGYGEELKVGDDILIPDDLTGTPEEFAAKINGAIPSVASPETTETQDPGDTNPDRAEENAAVTILNDIIAGKYADSGSISDALDQAAEQLEGAGLMELYDDRLNAAADYLTEVLKKEAA